MEPLEDANSGRMGGKAAGEDPRIKRRAVAAVPVGTNATEKAEIFKEPQGMLKAEEERGRKLLTEELASLELDFILSESKVWLSSAANDS